MNSPMKIHQDPGDLVIETSLASAEVEKVSEPISDRRFIISASRVYLWVQVHQTNDVP